MQTTKRDSADQAEQKVDSDEVFLELTKSICPVCKQVTDAEVFARDNKIFLRKRCPDHGLFEALTYGDAEMYFDSLRYNKPGTHPLETQTESVDGCPLDCGLCPEHKQHACLGIIEINSGCNLDCPLCFADSGHQPDGFSLTIDQVESAIDAFVVAEGEPEVLMISGGEPTLHPRLIDFIDLAKAKGVRHVIVNTNGLKLAKNKRFAHELAERDTGIYLQFDGLEEATHITLRGRDLRKVKQQALDNCELAGLTVTLVAAIEKSVNEHEVGAIIRHGIDHPAVRAVAFQPATHVGRHIEFDPTDRLTNPDIIHGIADQLPEWFKASDFFPVPCCFPTCRSVTYVLVDPDSDTVVPITRLIDVDDYLDYITNRVLPDTSAEIPRETVQRALEGLWSASAVPGTSFTNENLECATCNVTVPGPLRELADRAFMIVIQDFQDAYTLNVKQLMKCCVEQLTPDGRIIPFCAYNSVGYREQVREQLSGERVATVVPNSAELAGDLVSTAYGSRTHIDIDVGRGHVGGNTTNRGRSLR